MKRLSILSFALIALLSSAVGQGTLVYDQQSSTNEVTNLPGGGLVIQQQVPPWGQSFTPSLSAVGFVRLGPNDGNASDGLGATMYLNLIAGSIGGTIIGTSAPVTMPNNFGGYATFYFP